MGRVIRVNDFARRLKDCREKKKTESSVWTQRYVAEKIGMARTTYTAYENGTKMPPPDTINNIAILLDVSNDYLMGRTNITESYQDLNDLSTEHFAFLPVVAEISCGNPTFTEEDVIEYFPAEKALLTSGEYVWLKAKGSSMVNAGIRDGSKVLLRLQSVVENGDIAAVCIGDSNATLLKVYFGEDFITLVSENPSFADQVYSRDNISIKGKAVYVGSAL